MTVPATIADRIVAAVNDAGGRIRMSDLAHTVAIAARVSDPAEVACEVWPLVDAGTLDYGADGFVSSPAPARAAGAADLSASIAQADADAAAYAEDGDVAAAERAANTAALARLTQSALNARARVGLRDNLTRPVVHGLAVQSCGCCPPIPGIYMRPDHCWSCERCGASGLPIEARAMATGHARHCSAAASPSTPEASPSALRIAMQSHFMDFRWDGSGFGETMRLVDELVKIADAALAARDGEVRAQLASAIERDMDQAAHSSKDYRAGMRRAVQVLRGVV